MYNNLPISQDLNQIPYEETVEAFLVDPVAFKENLLSNPNSFAFDFFDKMLRAFTTFDSVYPSYAKIAEWIKAECDRTAMRHSKWFEDRGFFRVIRNFWQTNIFVPNPKLMEPKFLMSLGGLFPGVGPWIAKTVTLLNSISYKLLNLGSVYEVNEEYSLLPTPVEGLFLEKGPPWDP